MPIYATFFLVDCQWNVWGSWESCPVSCGGGFQTRTRSKKVEKQFGGFECVGEDTESQTCGCNSCPSKIYTCTLAHIHLKIKNKRLRMISIL